MENWKTIGTFIVVFLILCLIYLGLASTTGKVNIFGFEINIPFLDKVDDDPLRTIPKEKFETYYFEPSEPVFKLGGNATVGYFIRNPNSNPYEIKIIWIYNNSEVYLWNGSSKEYDKDLNLHKGYNAYYGPIEDKGIWKVQLTIEYLAGNITKKLHNFTEFLAIE